MSPRIGLDLQTVVDAAVEIVDRRGYDELTLATLAEKLGVKTPSLYNHIEGLPSLRNRLAIVGLRKLNDALTQAAVGRSRDEAIIAIAEAYLSFVRSHPGLYDATMRVQNRQDQEMDLLKNNAVRLIARVLEGYGLKGERGTHIIRGLRSVLHGFADLERSDQFNIPIDVDESLHIFLDIFLSGLHRSEFLRKEEGQEESREV